MHSEEVYGVHLLFDDGYRVSWWMKRVDMILKGWKSCFHLNNGNAYKILQIANTSITQLMSTLIAFYWFLLHYIDHPWFIDHDRLYYNGCTRLHCFCPFPLRSHATPWLGTCPVPAPSCFRPATQECAANGDVWQQCVRWLTVVSRCVRKSKSVNPYNNSCIKSAKQLRPQLFVLSNCLNLYWCNEQMMSFNVIYSLPYRLVFCTQHAWEMEMVLIEMVLIEMVLIVSRRTAQTAWAKCFI